MIHKIFTGVLIASSMFSMYIGYATNNMDAFYAAMSSVAAWACVLMLEFELDKYKPKSISKECACENCGCNRSP